VPDTIPLRPDPAAADPGEDLRDRPAAHAGADRPNPAPAAAPLLVPARAAAALYGVSLATWHRWHAGGRVPAPVRIGATVRWRREELAAHIAAGCPARREWEARRAAGGRR
jgi:predicted DNA-binding transcriptional regulator AlpA